MSTPINPIIEMRGKRSLRHEPTTAKKTREELAALRNSASKTLEILETLHFPARSSLMENPWWIERLERDLANLVRRADLAQKAPLEDALTAGTIAPGKQRDRATMALSVKVGALFQHATGLSPTVGIHNDTHPNANEPYGAFYDLLAQIFVAMDITSSAEFWARQVAKLHSKARALKENGSKTPLDPIFESFLSIGIQTGPPIGVQKGPLGHAGWACPGSEQEGPARPRSAVQMRWRSGRVGGACLPTWASPGVGSGEGV